MSPKPVMLETHRFGEETPATPLVVAHGLFGSGRNWATLARRFAVGEAGPARLVLSVDMRNHGASPWSAEMDYPSMAADLLEVIDREAGGRAVLLGHSMGGKAAMAAALTRPEAIAALCVADIAPVAYADHAHGHFVAAMQAVDLAAITRRSDADPLLAGVVPEAPLRAFLLQNLVIEGAAARWRLNLDGLAEAMPRLVGWPERYAEMAAYAGPSFFYHGGASDYVDATGRAEIARLFQNAEIDAMPEGGHWLHAERPDAFFDRVSAWLATV